ncbi:MAG TPA: hypothetical protein VFZ58_05265 [Candidatus Saccharimonadales bacterium]
MIDCYRLDESRDNAVANIAASVQAGATDAATAAISVTAQVLGVSWRNLAGRVIHRIERMSGDQLSEDVRHWVEDMKSKGVNSSSRVAR